VPFHIRGILVAIFVTLLVWVGWKLRQPRWQHRLRRCHWRRQWTGWVVGLTIATLVITSPPGVALAAQTLTSFVPTDSGQRADAIVILGRGSKLAEARITAATALWQAQRAPQVFVSGVWEAKPIVAELAERGIPVSALGGEGCSLTTEENARFTAEILLPQGLKRIVLVTDAPHMLRSLLTFRSLGFEVFPHAVALPSELGHREEALVWLREYAGLISYGLKGRFQARTVD
jgi:uncharacterized SAM-binding protein YcdF (DUF218 family)